MKIRLTRWSAGIRLLALLGLLLFCAGCSTPAWRGTPYYHTKPDDDPTAAKERVFVPPFAVYRSPTLDLALGLFELSDEYMTLRPLYSVYGLDNAPDKRVHSFLWPLAQFDGEHDQNRIVPFFWGMDYFVGFPLYWHFGNSSGDGGVTDTLFPLWFYSSDRQGFSFNILWPVFNIKDRPDGSGWRLWPLVGAYSGRTYSDYYRFVAWPLAHQWSAGGGEGTAVLPLFVNWTTPGESSFYSLLYSRHRDDQSRWDLLLPLLYHSRNPAGSKTFTPLYFRGESADQNQAWQLLLPIFFTSRNPESRTLVSLPYSCYRDADSRWDLVFPLLYHSRDPEGSKTYSPLFLQGESADRSRAWQLLLPLYYSSREPGSHTLVTLPYSRHRDADSRWDLVFPLLYHSRDPEGSKTYSPLFLQGESADRSRAWQFLLPLYYSSRDPSSRRLLTLLGGMSQDEEGMGWAALPLLAGGVSRKDGSSLFLSVPWSSGTSSDGSHWSMIPPLMFKSDNGKDRSLYTPLYSAGTSDNGARSWQTVFPLWYRSQGDGGGMVATLAGGWQTDAAGRSWLIWPLLSGGYRGDDSRDLWVIAPLFHARWDQRGLSHHLLPLYWWDAGDRRLISPFISSWKNRDRGIRTTLVPPALTIYSAEPKRKDLWTIAGLTHLSWGDEPGSSHVLPLFYRNPKTDTFLSLPWSRWSSGEGATNTLIAPALSWVTRREDRSDLWAVGPVAHYSWGKEPGSSHILPLFYRNPETDRFLSLPWSRWSAGEGATNTLIAPALSWVTRQEDRNDLWAVGPMAHYSWGKDPGSSHVLPLFYRNPKTDTFLSLPWSRWSSGEGVTNTLVAPALSWLTRRKDRSDLWMLGPLSHISWGQNEGASHIFPLFYSDTRDDTFISLPYTHWKDGDAERFLYPPLLSMYTRWGDERRLDALLGLFSERWGGDRREGYLIPLYYYKEGRSFFTPLFGRFNDPESGFIYPLTPLVGVRTGSHSGGWVFPFWSRNHDKKKNSTTGTVLWGSYSDTPSESQSSLIPFYYYHNRKQDPGISLSNTWGTTYGKTFVSLPAIWYRNTVEVNPVLDANRQPSGKVETSLARDHGCFPLWTYTHLQTPLKGDETYGSLLLLLYNYNTTIKPAGQEGEPSQTTVHKRVLWWLWNYQRNNEMVSVDVFPGLTYDAGADGFRKWSFLWRAFRYEKGPDGKKLDLLYIPIRR